MNVLKRLFDTNFFPFISGIFPRVFILVVALSRGFGGQDNAIHRPPSNYLESRDKKSVNSCAGGLVNWVSAHMSGVRYV